ncbi:MAG: ABC transporter permease subunit [Spirulina sp. SIO3F2]|nr:ABC transporter permease subunit [Spirulina sp. SIO3F2]
MTFNQEHSIPFWRDDRFWKIALQVIAVVVVAAFASLLLYNLNINMQRAGLKFGFDFLDNQASFDILDSVAPYSAIDETYKSVFPYSPTDNYARVLQAGLVNSLLIMVSGIILTTIVGIIIGVFQFSDNWLLRKGSELYIEVVRNTPLLLQLFFWYSAVFSQLPRPKERLDFFGALYLSKRGIFMPWPATNPLLWFSLGLIIVGVAGGIWLWFWRTNLIVEKGQSGQTQLWGLWAIALTLIVVILFGLGWAFPHELTLDPSQFDARDTERFAACVAETYQVENLSNPTSEANLALYSKCLWTGNFEYGLRLSLEFAALLVGLVIYTAAFIAEIVRAGIQSVAQGQWEAARALGLHSDSTMRLVVFPQALRVIIPPLNSQYQNLAKNSSLGAAIAYAELYNVANTTYNQSGRPIDVMLIIALTYLSINMVISLTMNAFNRAVQLKER